MSEKLALINGEDWYAVRDYSKEGNAISIREGKPVRYKTGDSVLIGRELCLPSAVFIPPDCDLCSVMGKELACEDLAGIARIVWSTTRLMDSKVFMGLSQGGPYSLVHSDQAETQCHDVQVPVIGIGATHYFYVESESVACGTLTSAEYLFCVGSAVIASISGLKYTAELATHTPVPLTFSVGGFGSEIHDFNVRVPESGVSSSFVLSTSTPTSITDTESGFSVAITTTVAPTP